jgi:hypothetical protein
MKLMIGDMFSVLQNSHIFAITTNGQLKSDGSLIMGAGIAGAIKDRYPAVPAIAGKHIIWACKNPSVVDDYFVEVHEQKYTYGFLRLPNTSIALFQTKLEVHADSKIQLIDRSVHGLLKTIRQFERECGAQPVVNLNFPGIGLGGLTKEQVMPCIEVLPDCVNVWMKG